MIKMETDTLSSYEQTQDKHVLDDSMDINIPRNEELNDSHETKEIDDNSQINTRIGLKDSVDSDITENHKVSNESSENKENENNGDICITNTDDSHQQNKVDSDKGSTVDDEKDDIESEQRSPVTDTVNGDDDADNGDDDANNTADKTSQDEDDKKSVSDEEKDPLNVDTENENKDASSTEHIETKDSVVDNDNKEEASSSTESVNHEISVTEDNPSPPSREQDKVEDDGESKIGDKNEPKTSKSEDGDESKEDKDASIDDTIKNFPLLKETLTKARLDDVEPSRDTECENSMEDIDMDEDFDPSLLCPDIAMEVDEAPVITSNENPPTDGNKSPLLYEPIFSTYVDEMTGAEVSFNLSIEEHKLRQELYGEANPVQYTKVHCTACNVHLGSALDGQSNRFVHPLLKVLICKDCYHFYTSGEFEKDEDGSELYCRWCGQGGQVICCSSCEMVFCKKCIRINYGRKKLTEIRDSDEWLCFRCDPVQLTSLRVHCAEFMEYVRREISRAATLENATSFMTTDYTQCCLAQKKKYVDPQPSEPKKKKRKSVNDPDYDPMKDRSLSPQPSTSTAPSPPAADAKLVPILPKPVTPTQSPGVVGQVGQATTMFRVGNTTFRPRASTFSQPRPRVQVINPTSVRQSGPGYIKIMPGGVRLSQPNVRAQNAQSFSPRQPSFQHRPVRGAAANPQMKHEWFEKTVRAAARVNSNLSYTLTQLNRAQANAASVEALAVVHNKLQEILSTSINSLIQIRKNLRTEFIAGIKNIRFPPKPVQPQPSTSSQDDDVIFVSPTTSVPPPLVQSAPSNSSPLSAINLPPSVSLTKRVPSSSSTASSSPKIIPSTSNGDDKPKVFLRVKSLMALQNVPSECITIPDDPLPPPPPLTPLNQLHEITIIDNSLEKNKEIKSRKLDDSAEVSEVTFTSVSFEKRERMKEKPAENLDLSVNGTIADKENEDTAGEKNSLMAVKEDSDGAVAFDMNNTSATELKKIFNIKVLLTRSDEIDAKVKQLFGLVNGDSSE